MIKKFLIFSFLLTLINSHFLFYENPMCSPIYQCMPDPTNTRCVETKTKEGLETQYVQKCGMDTECQLNETSGIGECVSQSLQAVPGYFCEYDSQCISGVCKDRTCIGKGLNEDCTNEYECNPGLYCKDNKCATLLKEGSPCTKDIDCETAYGCLNNVCTAYFSLDEDVETTSEMFCKSYYMTVVVEGEVNKTKCATLTRKENSVECGTEQTQCEYSAKAGEIINTFSLDCKCSLSSPDIKVCPLGNTEDYTNAITAWKTYFTEYSSKLETSSKKYIIDVSTYKEVYKATDNTKAYNVDDCVLSFIKVLYGKLPPKEPEKCPFVYKCNTDKTSNTCANVIKTTEGLVEKTVKNCTEGQNCIMDGAVGTCTADTELLLPGLYCYDGKQCLSGICENNTCIGNNETSSCRKDEDCHVGLYCSNLQCVPLLKVGEECKGHDSRCVAGSFCKDFQTCALYL